MSAGQKPEASGKKLPEGVFLPIIDFNMLVWMALQNCVNVIIFGKHTTDFTSTVRVLSSHILPEWQDDKFKVELQKGDGSALSHYRAIVNLLHRRGFFDTNRMDAGHL